MKNSLTSELFLKIAIQSHEFAHHELISKFSLSKTADIDMDVK